jgi:hypothetical protein
MYAYLRDDNARNPNPIVISNGAMIQSSDQISGHLLCAACEQRFNNRGERWMINHCFRLSPRRYRIHQQLIAHPPLLDVGDDLVFYSGKVLPGIDSLVYFAASVFWRAAVHEWIGRGGICHIELGPYAEALRRFLLGEAAFPQHMILVVMLARPDKARPVAYFPRHSPGERNANYRMYDFLIPGVRFVLFVGQTIPDYFKPICAATSRDRTLGLSDDILEDAFRKMARSLRCSRT